MSCIAGIVRLDGGDADQESVARMTSCMKGRAPDAHGLWCDGPVALGHAMLRIAPESRHETQPMTLDGRIWVSADIRIDAREQFIRRLRSAGRPVKSDAPDPELLLHGYHAFGESVLDHLIGDFAFALWDGVTQKLLCARDHFGVRPLYYSLLERSFIFASDVDAVLQHPGVEPSLDDEAVADFIFFGAYQQPQCTIYRNVRSVPPASLLILHGGGASVKRYWQLPSQHVVRYRDDREYVENFRAVFDDAVNDRIRTDHIALELSGGMDSTSIAAIAAKTTRQTGHSITAYTRSAVAVLPEDQEAEYAVRVAKFLEIPCVVFSRGLEGFFDRAGHPDLCTAEPQASAFMSLAHAQFSQISRTSRVLLSGHGGDALFDNSNHYFMTLLKAGRFDKLALETYRHFIQTGSIRGMGWFAALAKGRGHESWRPPFPAWLNPGFAAETQLEARWDRIWRRMQGGSGTFHQLGQPWLASVFGMQQPFKLPVVLRYPFYDLRLVHLSLGLPNETKRDKILMRTAMRGELPDEVLRRPKTALAGDVVGATLVRTKSAARLARLASGLSYINAEMYRRALVAAADTPSDDTWSTNMLLAPAALNIWLSNYGARKTFHDY